MTETREQLQQDLAEVEWRLLRTHTQRDTVILVDPALDLVEVAERVAADDGDQVGAWIAAGQLAKPSAAQLDAWEAELDRPFRMLIVRPYILAQPVAAAD